MTATETIVQSREQFMRDLERLSQDDAPEWLRSIRTRGEERFAATPLPHTRMEEWRQTNISAITETAYQSSLCASDHSLRSEDVLSYLYAPGEWVELVFVDGFFDSSLSSGSLRSEKVLFGGLQSAIRSRFDIVQRHLDRHLNARNAYTALNSAFLNDGGFLYVPKDTVVEKPVHFIFLSTGAEPDASAHIRNLFVLESGAEASIVVSFVSHADETRYLNNVVDEVALGPNASLKYYKIVEEGAAGNHLATTEVHQERDSRFKGATMTLTGAIVRNQLCSALDAEGAEVNLNGLYLNDGDRLIDNHVDVSHLKPGCTSRMMYKGVLDGKSKSVFTGKVHVHHEAQRTDSNQLSNNLLLSDRATIDAKPQLEIYADDVKCTHGATIGAPPAEIIFYFRSRGIDEATARAMLTYGFAEDVVRALDLEVLVDRLGRYVYSKYSPGE